MRNRIISTAVFAVIIAACLFLSGCATIITGSKQKVLVTSEPPGAAIVVDGKDAGVTPAVIRLKRVADHKVEISKEGYRTATVTLSHTISGATCGNVLLGGIIGMALDGLTGSIYKLVPGKVDVRLEVEGT